MISKLCNQKQEPAKNICETGFKIILVQFLFNACGLCGNNFALFVLQQRSDRLELWIKRFLRNDQTRFSCRFLACFGDDRFLLFCGAFFIIVSIFDVALDFQKLSLGIFDFFDDDCI